MNTQIKTLTDRLKTLFAKRAKLQDELLVWASVRDQGIHPDDVESFGFREEYLAPGQLKCLRAAFCGETVMGRMQERIDQTMFNAVRLKDGSVKQLNPMIRRP